MTVPGRRVLDKVQSSRLQYLIYSDPNPANTQGLTLCSDTTQPYRKEQEAGFAIRKSGHAREDIYITTKYFHLDGLDIEASIQNSLEDVSAPLCPEVT